MHRFLAATVLALAVISGIAPAFACSTDNCEKPSCSDTNSC